MKSAMRGNRLKFKSLFVITALAAMALSSCKPKETTITGQVFVATAGGVSFRLGAVEVEIIEKEQVVEFLRKQGADIEFHIQNKRNELEVVRKNIEKAKSEIEQIQAHIKSQPWTTTEDYVHATTKAAKFAEELASWENRVSRLKSQAATAAKTKTSSSTDALRSAHPTESNELSLYVIEMLKNNAQFANQWEEAQQGKQKSSERYNAALQEMAGVSSNVVAAAQRELDSHIDVSVAEKSKERILELELQKLLKRHYLPEDYFASFTPTVAKSANTDADGNFTLSYPRNKAFTIFAKAQRKTMEPTPEKYFWLIDCPNKDGRVLLNNNNVVDVDPDGYLKPKP